MTTTTHFHKPWTNKGGHVRVTPATQAVDKRITPINPHPHLQAAVVVA